MKVIDTAQKRAKELEAALAVVREAKQKVEPFVGGDVAEWAEHFASLTRAGLGGMPVVDSHLEYIEPEIEMFPTGFEHIRTPDGETAAGEFFHSAKEPEISYTGALMIIYTTRDEFEGGTGDGEKDPKADDGSEGEQESVAKGA